MACEGTDPRGQEWTIRLCPECGEHITESDYDPARGRIYGHYHDPPDDWPEGEPDPWIDAEPVPVVPASLLREVGAERDRLLREIDHVLAAPKDADLRYWQERCLDHASALDDLRVEHKRLEAALRQIADMREDGLTPDFHFFGPADQPCADHMKRVAREALAPDPPGEPG